MIFSKVLPLVGLAAVACSPDDPDPCEEGYAAYTDGGERLRSLSDLGDVSDGSSLVLHLCAGTHYTTSYGFPMNFTDYVYDTEEARYVIVGAGESKTIIDGEGVNSLLWVSDSSLKVSDLTIQNGGFDNTTTDEGTPSTTGGAGAVTHSSAIVFERVTFDENVADNGAAVFIRGSVVTMIDSHVEGNRGAHGGAVALYGPNSTLISENTVWHNNSRADVSFIDDETGDRLDSFDGGSGTFTCTWDTLSCE